MLTPTVRHLRCPKRKRGRLCGASLRLRGKQAERVTEIRSGEIDCPKCGAEFPILAGVAIVVEDPASYIIGHVKGISQQVSDSEIPRDLRADYQEAKAELHAEHIEEDLEAERVNALYLMTHYLHTNGKPWWKPDQGEGSPVIDALVREHWDRGPFAQIAKLVSEWSKGRKFAAVELGCGVGGLARVLRPALSSYLGVDSSFASIALARRIALGVPGRGALRVPADLLQGTVSREAPIETAKSRDGTVDFIVGDIENPPLAPASWDLSVALNAIDMLERPESLPEAQRDLVRVGGAVIQSCPYVWHSVTAQRLRKKLPKGIVDSARAVEWLYEHAGLKVIARADHVPWLFFKHLRQLEIYSVHLFLAARN